MARRRAAPFWRPVRKSWYILARREGSMESPQKLPGHFLKITRTVRHKGSPRNRQPFIQQLPAPAARRHVDACFFEQRLVVHLLDQRPYLVRKLQAELLVNDLLHL